MGKKIVLLVIGCLLVFMAGCSGNGKSSATSAAVSQNQKTPTSLYMSPQQPANSEVGHDLYFHSLALPNGKVITSYDQEAYDWQGLSIRLYSPMAYSSIDSLAMIEGVLGNHCEIVSQKPVTLAIGPAMLGLGGSHTPPAASGYHTVAHECWLIVLPGTNEENRNIAYAIQAVLDSVSPGDASSELLKLSRGWTIPTLQTQGPGKR